MSEMIWQPISTAPKDGTFVKIKWYNPASGMVCAGIARWTDRYWPLANKMVEDWWLEEDRLPFGQPTHWMPKPPPKDPA